MNIYYTILDDCKETKSVSYEDIIEEVEIMDLIKRETLNDHYINMVVEYNDYFTLNELRRIADYYGLNVDKNKGDLINNIIEFEKTPSNMMRVCKRKKLWAYMKEIKEDKYLAKYIHM